MLLAARWALGRFAGGRRLKETLLFGMPVLGRLARDTILSRAADATALLVASGCDLPTCLRLAGGASGSELVRGDFDMLAGHVEAGESLAGAGGSCRVLPTLFLYSMELGSQRNDLAEGLRGLSEMYAGQARASQGRLQGLLLPTLLVVAGSLVGLAITAMFLPIVHVLTAMQAY